HEPTLSAKAKIPEITTFFCQAVIRGEDHATFAGRDVLVGIKAESSYVAKRTDAALSAGLAAIALADLFGAVFNHFEPILLGEFHHWIHVHGESIYVNHHNGFGPRSDFGFDLSRINVPS